MIFVLLITAPPAHISAWHAYYFAESALAQGHKIRPFFYGDGVGVANRLLCPAQDELSLAQLWRNLADIHQFELPVCVAAALRRGLTDTDNAHRHQLEGDNLDTHFVLAGLGVLTEGLITADRVLSFIGDGA
jgi:tRNA 2-thiouridine synthesizing protein D